jgi:hypothetical protein
MSEYALYVVSTAWNRFILMAVMVTCLFLVDDVVLGTWKASFHAAVPNSLVCCLHCLDQIHLMAVMVTCLFLVDDVVLGTWEAVGTGPTGSLTRTIIRRWASA